MITRYISAAGTGTLTTFGLLYVMTVLMDSQPGVMSEAGPRFAVDWRTVLKPEEPTPPPQPRIERNTILNPPAPPARPHAAGNSLIVARVLNVPPQAPGTSVPPTLQMVDGPIVNIVRVSPVYPAIAERQGLEGYVIVQFDVLADGQVANASVVESSNRVFERSAIQAAQRFRFKPRVVDGAPQVTTGLQNLFRFEMEGQVRD